MRTPDISSLVTGILTVVAIAIGLGQYGKLETWARKQAMEAMLWKHGLPNFFAPVPSKRLSRKQELPKRKGDAPNPMHRQSPR